MDYFLYMILRLEHPNKLLHTMFEKLYDDEIISEDAFFMWEKNDDPSEQASQVALDSYNYIQLYNIIHHVGGEGRGLEILYAVSYLAA